MAVNKMTNNAPLLLLYESLCDNERYAAAGGTDPADAQVQLFPLRCRHGMTSERPYVVVAYTEELTYVYRGEPKLTYWIPTLKVAPTQRNCWLRDLRAHCIAPLALAATRYGARPPEEAPRAESDVLHEIAAVH